MKKKNMLILLRIGLYIICGMLAFQVIGCAMERVVLFPKYMIPKDRLIKPQSHIQVWTIDTDQGQVQAWFIPAKGASENEPRPMMIFAHGNCELINQWQFDMLYWRDRGVHVLLPEYRGYGRSAGSPSQARITDDFIRFYDMAVQRPEVDADRVIFNGRSIGGGIVTSLARHRRPAAMILQSSFTSIPDIAKKFLILPMFIRDKLDVKTAIKEYNGPVLITHGDADEVVPVSHAHILHATASAGTLIIYNGLDHNTLPPEAQYWGDMENFMVNAGLLEQLK